MILRTARRGPRRGYTLLEVLLAAMLATLVLAAVYMLMNVTVQQTQATRDAVEVEDLTRGVFTKIGIDLSGTLAPLPPKSGGNNAASGATSSTPSSSSSTGSAAPTGTAAAAAPADPSAAADPSAPDPSAPGATDSSTAVAADYAFQGGVIGDEKKLIIFAGRVPEAFGRYGNPGEQVRSDQRQIIYWLGKSGTGGLYRRERPWVTADDVRTAADDDETATDSTLLAEEVADLIFEYSDGANWATTWDGTAPGPDGVTPLGPPRAIRVTLTLQIPVSRGEPITKQVSHVIAVRSAPGTYTPPLLEAPTDGGDNAVPADPSSGSTTGANGSGATGGGAGSAAPAASGSSGAKAGGSTPAPAPSRPATGAGPTGGTGSMGGAKAGGSMGAPTGGASRGTGSTGAKGGGR